MTKKLHKLHWDNYYESELVSIVWVMLFVHVRTHSCVVPVSVLGFFFACLLSLRWIKGEGCELRRSQQAVLDAELLKGCLYYLYGIGDGDMARALHFRRLKHFTKRKMLTFPTWRNPFNVLCVALLFGDWATASNRKTASFNGKV